MQLARRHAHKISQSYLKFSCKNLCPLGSSDRGGGGGGVEPYQPQSRLSKQVLTAHYVLTASVHT